ncbi:MAG: hypothetical protein IPJ88_11605 [Myxococcales bacterium]|nr:MAG: hypothetical protein IPJ88_11605 [Myxococcales bacterium]
MNDVSARPKGTEAFFVSVFAFVVFSGRLGGELACFAQGVVIEKSLGVDPWLVLTVLYTSVLSLLMALIVLAASLWNFKKQGLFPYSVLSRKNIRGVSVSLMVYGMLGSLLPWVLGRYFEAKDIVFVVLGFLLFIVLWVPLRLADHAMSDSSNVVQGPGRINFYLVVVFVVFGVQGFFDAYLL